MDDLLKLYNNGQYRAVYNSLLNEQGTDKNQLIDQLLHSNNIYVCKLLMVCMQKSLLQFLKVVYLVCL